MDFQTSVDRLLTQVGHWEAPRWKDRAEPVHDLVQHLADLTADAEGRPHREVPRLAPTILPDQLRVMADDLLRADPADDSLAVATALVDKVRQIL